MEPQKLRPDSGEYFRDPNAARSPTYPIMPAILALFAMQPDVKTSSIDVVSCGNTMGGLLKFASSTERTFRFGVEVIGNTVFFVRKENSPRELIPGVHGYGHTFPESYTIWDAGVQGSASHQRLVKYQFGGLAFLVRFKSDGYLKNKIEPEDQERQASVTPVSKPDLDIPSLLQGTDLLTVTQKVHAEQGDVKVELKGQKIPQSAVFDLKTRSAKNEIDMKEVFSRLWATQTPNFIIGYHKSGYFDDVRVQDVSGKVGEWEAENGELLGRLQSTIQRIIDVAKSSAGQRLEVCRIGSGKLQIRKHVDGEWSALPPHLKDAWTKPPGDQQHPTAASSSSSNDAVALASVAQQSDRLSPEPDARDLTLGNNGYANSDDDWLAHHDDQDDYHNEEES